MAPPKKALVISNCQARVLAHALSVMSTDTTFHHWGVHEAHGKDREMLVAEKLRAIQTDYDFVLAVQLSDKFGDISAPRIRDATNGKPVFFVSNIYFTGLHPDMVYVGAMGERIVSPLGDYHSKLALWSFATGKQPDQAADYFRDDVYEALGYYGEWDLSLQEAQKRDQAVDVPVHDIIPQVARRETAFYSFNHPSPALVAPFAARIIAYLQTATLVEASGIGADPHMIGSPLVLSSVFPVYPEVARKHGLPPHIGSYAFKPNGAGINPFSLDTFLSRSHRLYEKYGREKILQSVQKTRWFEKLSEVNPKLK